MTRIHRQRMAMALTGTWFAVIALGIGSTAHRFHQWRTSTAEIDQLTDRLAQGSKDITAAVDSIKTDDQETIYLQSLVDVLPQEKSFVRTELAMSDEVDALRRKVARHVHNDLQIVVDTRANKLYLKRGLALLWSADCSVGKGGILFDRSTGRHWEFVTPRGQLEVLDKYVNPSWHKPDWAFVEAGEPIPPPDDPSRDVKGELGNFVLNLGDGYLIHGTKSEALLGHPMSHGCVRLGAVDLKKLYETVPRGTRVYIY